MDSLVGRPAPWTALWGGWLRGQPCGEAGSQWTALWGQNSVVMATCNTTGREVRSSFSEEETHMQMWGNVTTHALPIHIENSPSTSVILVVIIQSLRHV